MLPLLVRANGPQKEVPQVDPLGLQKPFVVGEPELKVENRRLVSAEPHSGQGGGLSGPLFINVSNFRPQFPHSNS